MQNCTRTNTRHLHHYQMKEPPIPQEQLTNQKTKTQIDLATAATRDQQTTNEPNNPATTNKSSQIIQQQHHQKRKIAAYPNNPPHKNQK